MLYVSVLFPLPGRMGMEPSQGAFLGCEVQMCGNYEKLCYLCFEAHCFLHMGFAHRNIFNCAEAQPDIAGWSSLVARRAHNPEVVGSNPAPATKNSQLGGLIASELFCYLPKL